MSRVLIVGDSQAAGPAGRAADAAFRAAGRDVLVLAQVGKGPVSWAGSLWSAYTQALSDHRPQDVVFIFGSNDHGSRLAPAIEQLRSWAAERFAARVWYSGPPHYPDPERERIGASIRSRAAAVFGDRYIDAWPHTPVSAGRAPDGVHLTASAGRPWGEAIAATVLGTLLDVPAGEGPLAPREGDTATAPASSWPWIAGAALVGLGLGLGLVALLRR